MLIKGVKRALVVVAHPDDEVLMMKLLTYLC